MFIVVVRVILVVPGVARVYGTILIP